MVGSRLGDGRHDGNPVSLGANAVGGGNAGNVDIWQSLE